MELKLKAAYPNKKKSKNLVLGNGLFFKNNFAFSCVVGGLYWFIGMLMHGTPQYNAGGSMWTNPFLFISMATLGAGLWAYAKSGLDQFSVTKGIAKNFKQEKIRNWLALGFAGVHTLAHGLAIVGLYALFSELFPIDATYRNFWLFLLGMVGCGSIVGGTIWGLYLILSSTLCSAHHNDAFSAMALPSYRNFLRMKIVGNQLTIYPIGLDEVPERNGWRENPRARSGEQDEPRIEPINELKPRLIEKEITTS